MKEALHETPTKATAHNFLGQRFHNLEGAGQKVSALTSSPNAFSPFLKIWKGGRGRWPSVSIDLVPSMANGQLQASAVTSQRPRT